MKPLAIGALPREQKGPLGPPPTLAPPLQAVVDIVSRWPGIDTTVHWHFSDRSRIDGVDFYWKEKELGHIHLDGWIHLATSGALGERLVGEGVAQAFPYQRGWVEADIMGIGTEAAVELFRRNYEALGG